MNQTSWRNRRGEKALAWKGDGAGYHAKHIWLTKTYGRGKTCEECGIVGRRLHWANISGEYKRNRTDYRELCPSCHKKFDSSFERRPLCKAGKHVRTIDNQQYMKSGYYRCIPCFQKWKKDNAKVITEKHTEWQRKKRAQERELGIVQPYDEKAKARNRRWYLKHRNTILAKQKVRYAASK